MRGRSAIIRSTSRSANACTKACARRVCRRNEASLKAACGAGAMLVACPLAGLSALEAHYADVDAYGQMRITSWRGPGELQRRLPGTDQDRGAAQPPRGHLGQQARHSAQDRRELQRGHLRLVELWGAEQVSAKVTLGHFHHIRACFIEAAATFASL